MNHVHSFRARAGACVALIALFTGASGAQIAFEQTGTVEVGIAPWAIQAADLNGDTFLDLVTANRGDGTLSLVLGSGDGTFQAPVQITVDGVPAALCVADFNRDALLDLAVADSDGRRLAVLHNTGSAEFDAPIYYDLPLLPTALAAGDLDGDGWIDLAAGMSNPESEFSRNTGAILYNDGAGTLEAPTVFFTNITNIPSLQLADLDRTGDLDLLLGTSSDRTAYWIPNDGFGEFAAAPRRIRMGEGKQLALDVNGDDLVDVVGASDFGNGYFRWAFGLGDGNFDDSDLYTLSGFTLVTDLRAADFDGDGYPDFIHVNHSDGPGYRVVHNNGDGTMDAQQLVPVCDLPRGVAVGDFDGDERPDAAVADAATDTIFVLRNITPEPLLIDPVTTTLTHVCRESMRSADVDGDLDVDIIGLLSANDGQFTHGEVAVFLNNGQGGFGPPALYEAGAQSFYLDVGDLNGDGRPDVVVSNYFDGDASIFYNDGNGQFAPQQRLDVGGAPLNGVAIGDMDNDTRADIVLAGDRSRGILIAFQDEFGAFEVVDHRLDERDFARIALADLNGDDFLDVVAGVNSARDAAVFLNTGLRGLERRVDYEVGTTPRSLAVGDFDGDENADVAFGIEHNISVLYGVGDGTFGEAVLYSTPSATGVTDIKAADLNNDGHVDIVGAEVLNRRVISMLNDGAGALAESGSAYAASCPRIIAVGDFDGDEDTDVATISRPEGQVSLKRLTVFSNSTISDPGSLDGVHLRTSRAVRGRQAQLLVSGARGSERIHFLLGTRGLGLGQRVPLLGGLQLDLRSPVNVIDTAIADSLGNATLQVRVPPGAPVITVGLQAVARRGAGGRASAKTNPVLLDIE
ncbi:MAG: VCBS repeat-containing protein [Phycisphaerales bacterium]|nr:VCBS repeat-containing protein [Phycisphaerales bacterium]